MNAVSRAPLIDSRATAETVALWRRLHAARSSGTLFGHHQTDITGARWQGAAEERKP